MRGVQHIMVVFIASIGPTALAVMSLASDSAAVRDHAQQSFEQFQELHDHANLTATSTRLASREGQVQPSYSAEQYVVGTGQGDLTKGPIVCQRVSELSARTDLAKQIRIFVKEHMIDRIREHSGKEADQDIQLTREEIVQEYLQGVTIIDRRVDEEKKLCSATAVMPRSRLQPSPPPDEPPRRP